MQDIEGIHVVFNGLSVGMLARTKSGLYPFQYDEQWLDEGFSLNPLTLPLDKRVFLPPHEPLGGMFGVFCDSLPDGWGKLLVDRTLRLHGENPEWINGLQRLAIVGASGMGALAYEPDFSITDTRVTHFDFDILAKECELVLKNESTHDLDTIFELGGSSGGARPKILVSLDGDDWIIKFRSSEDPEDIGVQEYQYAHCAAQCGISVPEVRLFPSKRYAGYFGVKRFDRKHDGTRVHMISAAGLLETSHRVPNLDYQTLMKLTLRLTERETDIKRLYRQMCFNVFAHNRDDHSKNFSYLFDFETRQWHLSPAYDLTYSNSLHGEHATAIAGNGKNPGMNDLLKVADFAGLSKRWAKSIARDIQEIVQTELSEFLH